MGIFSFLKTIGKKVLPGREAEEITADISDSLGTHVANLKVAFDDGTVTIEGTVDSQATKEKAILLAGNVEGVEQVEIETPLSAAAEHERAAQGELLGHVLAQGGGGTGRRQLGHRGEARLLHHPER